MIYTGLLKDVCMECVGGIVFRQIENEAVLLYCRNGSHVACVEGTFRKLDWEKCRTASVWGKYLTHLRFADYIQ